MIISEKITLCAPKFLKSQNLKLVLTSHLRFPLILIFIN